MILQIIIYVYTVVRWICSVVIYWHVNPFFFLKISHEYCESCVERQMKNVSISPDHPVTMTLDSTHVDGIKKKAS